VFFCCLNLVGYWAKRSIHLIFRSVAGALGENAEAFLGTQGYIWDTQSDMALALLGAIIAIIVLAKYHDK
jgi:uncharacterized membrane protein YjdF